MFTRQRRTLQNEPDRRNTKNGDEAEERTSTRRTKRMDVAETESSVVQRGRPAPAPAPAPPGAAMPEWKPSAYKETAKSAVSPVTTSQNGNAQREAITHL